MTINLKIRKYSYPYNSTDKTRSLALESAVKIRVDAYSEGGSVETLESKVSELTRLLAKLLEGRSDEEILNVLGLDHETAKVIRDAKPHP